MDEIEVNLTAGELRYLIDVMWATTRHESQAYAVRHSINDVALEKKLQISLGILLSEE
jgi:hypothetical protein|tara:strand:- start:350 stop:523 length:174 start_codon:yes stop_codon:yes gene_type:complete